MTNEQEKINSVKKIINSRKVSLIITECKQEEEF